MQNSKWMIGSLLWEVARYWQRFIASEEGKAGFFSEFYPQEPELHLFANAIEKGESNTVSEMMQEAMALAQGMPKTEMSSDIKESDSISALSSILSHVRLEQNDEIQTFYHELPDFDKHHAFSVTFANNANIDKENIVKLLNSFAKELEILRNLNSHQKIEILLVLLEKYFHCLPPLDANENNDLPLFAVSKMATALLSCWEKAADKLPVAPVRSIPAYTLIQGDLSGIQDYIYRISSAKGAAKGLKGRSFELSLLSDMVAKYLLLKFGLSGVNIIYSSGGKFYILAPARTFSQLEDICSTFEEQFYKRFDGEIYLGLAGVLLSGNDLSADKFANKWQQANVACNATKQTKFASLITNQFDLVFKAKGIGQEKLTCDSCDREESDKDILIPKYEDEVLVRRICSCCDDLEDLGSILARAQFLVEVVNEESPVVDKSLVRLEPFDLKPKISYYIISKGQQLSLKGEAITYYGFERPDFSEDMLFVDQLKRPEVQVSFRFYGGKDLPLNEKGDPAEYDELANKSDGLKRLGVLRMDVDNLGTVFRYGLAEYKNKELLHQNASLVRMLALSWFVNYFFSYKLNQIRGMKNFKHNIFVVYSGGDDLFIVGSWDRVVEFAAEIRKAFLDFTHNPQLSISGGISIVPRKFPIHKAADLSGQAEVAAKQMDLGAKDAFTFLDKPLRWTDFTIAASICEELKNAIKYSGNIPGLNKGILERLRRIYLLYEQNRLAKNKLLKQKTIHIPQYLELLRYDKWRWMLTYSLWRFRSANKKYENLINRIQKALLDENWIDQKKREYPSECSLIDFIDVPTRWVEFLTRKESE